MSRGPHVLAQGAPSPYVPVQSRGRIRVLKVSVANCIAAACIIFVELQSLLVCNRSLSMTSSACFAATPSASSTSCLPSQPANRQRRRYLSTFPGWRRGRTPPLPSSVTAACLTLSSTSPRYPPVQRGPSLGGEFAPGGSRTWRRARTCKK